MMQLSAQSTAVRLLSVKAWNGQNDAVKRTEYCRQIAQCEGLEWTRTRSPPRQTSLASQKAMRKDSWCHPGR